MKISETTFRFTDGWHVLLNEMKMLSKRSRIFCLVGGDMKSDTTIFGKNKKENEICDNIWSLVVLYKNGSKHEKSSSILALTISLMAIKIKLSLNGFGSLKDTENSQRISCIRL